MSPLVLPEEVCDRLRGLIEAREPEQRPVADCAGLVLAETVVAPMAVPRRSNAAMDGFAVRAADTPGSLRVVAHAFAGQPTDIPVRSGEAVAIATGAWMPQGADAVVEVEATTAQATVVQVPVVVSGHNVRHAGEDVIAGAEVLHPGTRLGPLQFAVVTGLGHCFLRVVPPLRVAIVATGDEVRSAGLELLPGQVYDAITTALAALVREAGAQPQPHPPVADDRTALATALGNAAATADLVLSVGGASVGTRDVAATLPHAQQVSVALRPGRPLLLGQIDGVAWCGLPGNPLAALAAFEAIVRPALATLPPRVVRLRLTAPVQPRKDRVSLLPCRIMGGEVEALDTRRVGAFTAMAAADGWLRIDRGNEPVQRGDVVGVRLFCDRLDAYNEPDSRPTC